MWNTPARRWFGLSHFWDSLFAIAEGIRIGPRHPKIRERKKPYQPEIEGLERREVLDGLQYFAFGYQQPTSPHYVVDEGAGSVQITVHFGDTLGGAGHVDYTTTDGTAKTGQDYIGGSGTLSFAQPGDKTFNIPIIQDTIDEWDQDFSITLSTTPRKWGNSLGIAQIAAIPLFSGRFECSPT